MIVLPAAIMTSGFAEHIQHRKQKYNRFVRKLLEDGKSDEDERWRLKELRKELGLDSEESLPLLDAIMQEIQHTPENCPQSQSGSAVTPCTFQDLSNSLNGLGFYSKN